jgi:hypothetical protein
MEIDGDD